MSQKLFREPLVHFFAAGFLLFVLYGFLNSETGRAADEIVIDQASLSILRTNYEKTWQRPPTDDEMQSVIEAWVREEILYREGMAIGFDRDDPVIRRRVAQKMSFVADGMVPAAPTNAELEAWLQANAANYQVPASYTLQQVYVDPQRHRTDLDIFLSDTQAQLSGDEDPTSLGDSTLLPSEIVATSSVEIGRILGTAFVVALSEMTVGDWQGPIQSGYGLHFVRISEHTPARSPQLEEVRAAVERDLLNDRSKKINEAFYAALRERYTVRIESTQSDAIVAD